MAEKNLGESKLEMYGGTFGATLPLIIAVVGFVIFSIYERGAITAFWVSSWLGISVGILIAKNRKSYAESVFRGISRKEGAAIYVIWLFAGVLGQIWRGGGFVEGFVWLGSSAGLTGPVFVILTYFCALVLATGLGTSVGTVVALAPVLYPAGIALGADPVALALALIAGGAFGDNLGPISDTTIVSAYTQNAEIGDVVKSRFPISATAAVIAGIALFALASSGGTPSLGTYEIKGNPFGLVHVFSLILLLIVVLRGGHLIEATVYAIFLSMVLGLAVGTLTFDKIVKIPEVRGGDAGLIMSGIQGVVAPIIFVMLILGITQVLIDTGAMDKFIAWAQKTVAKTVRQAEASIAGFTVLITIPLAANAPGILIVSEYAKRVAEKFNLHPARAANLLDCAANTIFYTLPWHNAMIAWYTAVLTAAQQYGMPCPSILVGLINPYAWALLLVLYLSILTGWNRAYKGEKITYISGWKRIG
ncbi:MAG: Na+/H+ antiporter NhaC family protein [Archaeoglobaceae archaeon]